MALIINFIDFPDSLNQSAIQSLLNAVGTEEDLELSIKCVGDTDIQELNKTFRGKDKPTNVLSFPNDEGNYIGDIAISLETIDRESNEQEKTFQDHFSHMCLHGFLHLLGYDHETDNDAEEMESLEIQILSEFGIKNPYK